MKRIWSWLLSLPRSRQIALCVLGVHGFAVLAMSLNHVLTSRPSMKKPISIRTSSIEQRKWTEKAPSKESHPLKLSGTPPCIAPSEKNCGHLSKQIKTDHTLSDRKTSSVKKRGAAKGNPQHKRKEQTTGQILKELTESLEAISEKRLPSRPAFSIALPKSIELQEEREEICPQAGLSYGETIAAILQNALDLPEFGEVVARIEVDSNGSIVGCEILDERSRKNGEFLKNRLQELSFPCFNEFRLTENRLTFTVTFRNVENL